VAIGNIAPLAVAIVLAGCGSSLPSPPSGPQLQRDYEEVPYPPPAAAPEIISESPGDNAVWVDGQWVWRSRYYVWQRGGWVIPPPHTYYAPSDRRYGPDGTLYFAEGSWRRTSDQERLETPPPVVRPAASPPTPQTPETVLSP
jgi:hypothetical protein